MKNIALRLMGICGFAGSFASPAIAAITDYCTPVAQLTPRISSCTDNEVVFGEAAVLCLNKFEKDVASETAELKKSLVGGGASADGVKNQSGFYGGSESNYQEAKTRMTNLILTGRRAIEQIGEYRKNLAMPEDFENAKEMGFTVEEFVSSIPCYHENRKLLRDVGSDFLEKIEQLEDARDVAFANEKGSNVSKIGIGVNNKSVAIPLKNKPSQEPVFVKGKAKNKNQSDITGTERKPATLPGK